MEDIPPMYFEVEASTSRQKADMTKADVRQVVAMAVISRLQEWCVQLFWITIICVMGYCGDEKSKSTVLQLQQKQHQHGSRRRTNIAEIEMKLLRHLTSPQLSNLRPVAKCSKKRPASRPPSPQLFDIQEESEY